jgi:hypothetical protein
MTLGNQYKADLLPTPWHLNKNAQIKDVSHRFMKHSNMQNGTSPMPSIYNPPSLPPKSRVDLSLAASNSSADSYS